MKIPLRLGLYLDWCFAVLFFTPLPLSTAIPPNTTRANDMPQFQA